MRLSPRYDGPPVIAVEAREPGPHPVVQQRQRLEAILDQLSDDEWRAPSRCSEWTVQDVITHLHSTNRFWALSVAQARAGEPTRFLATFDPVASPAQLVDSTRGTDPAETLEGFRASSAEACAAFADLDEAAWDAVGEAPPGHVPLRLVADHALWDSWVHERDILLPLGRQPLEDPVEVLTCLRYAAGLGRAFEVDRRGGDGSSTLLLVDQPDARIVVTSGAEQVRTHDGDVDATTPTVELQAVPLLEMLSLRDAGAPVPAAVQALTAGLATVFDQVEAPEPA